MLDITLIREQPEWVKEQLAKLYDPDALARVDAITNLDKRRRALLTESETIQAARNKLNKGFGMLRGSRTLTDADRAAVALAAVEAVSTGEYERAASLLSGEQGADRVANGDQTSALELLMTALKAMGERVETLNAQIAEVDSALQDHMLWLPNMPHVSVPVAESEDANIAHPPEGEERSFDFEPKPHWELGPALDILDFERGIKLGGSRAYILKGMGARLQRALIGF
jgi:seryl-tRNA synthetase